MPEKAKKLIFVRLPEELIRKVDAHAKYLRSTVGIPVSRQGALRLLVNQGLAATKKAKK